MLRIRYGIPRYLSLYLTLKKKRKGKGKEKKKKGKKLNISYVVFGMLHKVVGRKVIFLVSQNSLALSPIKENIHCTVVPVVTPLYRCIAVSRYCCIAMSLYRCSAVAL